MCTDFKDCEARSTTLNSLLLRGANATIMMRKTNGENVSPDKAAKACIADSPDCSDKAVKACKDHCRCDCADTIDLRQSWMFAKLRPFFVSFGVGQ